MNYKQILQELAEARNLHTANLNNYRTSSDDLKKSVARLLAAWDEVYFVLGLPKIHDTSNLDQ
jgi:hypothetical protein